MGSGATPVCAQGTPACPGWLVYGEKDGGRMAVKCDAALIFRHVFRLFSYCCSRSSVKGNAPLLSSPSHPTLLWLLA